MGKWDLQTPVTISNRLAVVFDISLDELLGNTKEQKSNKEADRPNYRPNCENHDFGNRRYDIELTGWNGAYGVYIISEDRDFLYYYQGSDKENGILEENGYVNDFTDERHHHEIYLSDPRKVAPEKCKTVIRHPIKKL